MEQRLQLLSSVASKASKLLSFRIKSSKKFGASQGGDFKKKSNTFTGIGTRTTVNYLNNNFSKKKVNLASISSIARNFFFFRAKRKYKDIKVTEPLLVNIIWHTLKIKMF
jgi:hypothetical protein